jgi:hypothetical protein
VRSALRAVGLLGSAVILAGCSAGPHRQTVAADPVVARRPITVVADGQRRALTTTAKSVRDALAQAGITLGPYDRVMPALDAPAAGVITITRLAGAPITKTLTIPAPTIRKKVAKQPAWSRKVLRKGHPGRKRVLIGRVVAGGRTTRQVLEQTVTTAPLAKILGLGPTPSSVGGAAARLNWAALARCESHGNPHAINAAGYYGLYQFSLSSWTAVGGTGRPSDAVPAEQTYRAQLLYNRVQGRWRGQWPVCGPKLFS